MPTNFCLFTIHPSAVDLVTQYVTLKFNFPIYTQNLPGSNTDRDRENPI